MKVLHAQRHQMHMENKIETNEWRAHLHDIRRRKMRKETAKTVVQSEHKFIWRGQCRCALLAVLTVYVEIYPVRCQF